MEYSFYLYNKLAADGISMSADRLLRANFRRRMNKSKGAGTRSSEFLQGKQTEDSLPVIVCVGSDLAIGDSLGPICGSMLQYKTQGLNTYIYGTLSAPVTAKEIPYLRTFLSQTHQGSQILAIDAAVGEDGDVGLIKLSDTPLLPGAGAKKKLGAVGDISLLGIVAEKSVANYGLLNTTRLNLVYTMAELIADGIATLLWERSSKNKLSANG